MSSVHLCYGTHRKSSLQEHSIRLYPMTWEMASDCIQSYSCLQQKFSSVRVSVMVTWRLHNIFLRNSLKGEWLLPCFVVLKEICNSQSTKNYSWFETLNQNCFVTAMIKKHERTTRNYTAWSFEVKKVVLTRCRCAQPPCVYARIRKTMYAR